ncbi:MAG: hypothetical protein ACI3W5_09440 [Faecousia sp.]
MPSNWSAVDSNFPTFTGDESPKKQIGLLHNYMYVLTEQLRYSLANLNASNWNPTALQALQDGATAAIVKQVSQLGQTVSSVLGRLDSLQTSVASQGEDIVAIQSCYDDLLTELHNLLSAVQQTEQALGWLESEQQQLDERILALESNQEDIAGRMDELDCGVKVTQQEDGVTRVDITGALYINGVLFEGGTTA